MCNASSRFAAGTGGAHLLDYTALKHHFHSLIDSFVKLLPLAEHKSACSRFDVQST